MKFFSQLFAFVFWFFGCYFIDDLDTKKFGVHNIYNINQCFINYAIC